MDADERKLFVGGLRRETTEETLRYYFRKYGVVSRLLIAKDQITKLPRGFGFVVFSDPSSAARALQDNHVILGKTVEVKKAIPKTEKHQCQDHQQRHPHGNQEATSNGLGMNSDNSTGYENYRTKKIFVGGLSSSLTDEQFRNYFEKFGRTVDAVVMQDSSTNRPRGFGFITFDSEESVNKVMHNSFHELNGKTVEVKKAVPKDKINGHIGSGSSNGFFDNGPQPGNHAFYGPAYDPHYSPLLMYNGVQGYVYGMSFYGGVYPLVVYGSPGLGVSPMAPRSPLMPATGLFPYSNACFYHAYMHDKSSIRGMEVGGQNQIVEPGVNGEEVGGHNQIVEPGVNSEEDAVRDSNGHVPSNATAPTSEEGKVGSDALGLKGGDVDAVCDSNGHVEPGVSGEVDVVCDSNGHVPSNATAPPSEEGKDGSDALGLKGGDVDAVCDSNGHVEPGVNSEEVGGHNQIVEPAVNGEVDAVRDSNGHVPSNATAPPSEGKVGSDALGLQGSDVGALANGIE